MHLTDVSDRHANCFNSLRLLAALAVLVSHSWTLSGPYPEPLAALSSNRLSLGALAVHVFFAISGYLIVQSAIQRPHTWTFLKARALRILPALWVCLVWTVLVMAAWSDLPTDVYFSDAGTWAYFKENSLLGIRYSLPEVLTKNPYPGSVNGSLWTLGVEAFMYGVVAVLLALGVLVRRELVALFSLVMAVLWMKAPAGLPGLSIAWPSPAYAYHMLCFVLGALMFLYRDRLRWRLDWVMWAWLVVLASGNSSKFNLLVCLALSYTVICVGFRWPRDLTPWMSRSDVSYGVYLYAFPIQQMLASMNVFQQNPVGLALAAVPCALAMGAMSWHFVERPALRLKGTFAHRK